MQAGDQAELSQLIGWLREFEAQKGRPLRVLHIGNIAGNGYLNAKFQRSVGVDADVVSHDYQHVMSLPEWEDVELHHPHGDDNSPVFDPRDIASYRRPEWFIQGPLLQCVEGVLAHRGIQRNGWRKHLYRTLSPGMYDGSGAKRSSVATITIMALSRPRLFLSKVYAKFRYLLKRSPWIPGWGRRAVATFERQPRVRNLLFYEDAGFQKMSRKLRKIFGQRFPDRPDKLTKFDVRDIAHSISDFARMFAPYDIVQCYATEPIGALVCGKRPYVAFEHGTLRHFTTDDDPLHRMTALAYREAAHTFITNGDCLAYAQRLGIKNYSPIIHPVDVDQHRQDFSDDARAIREELGADLLIYCPVRHDYSIKGTDRALMALPLIKQRTEKRVVMILSAWGMDVEKSRAMIDEMGCRDNVVWLPSLCRIKMIKNIQAADVVFDQFVLPVFGSTAPQAISAGKPVLASYVPAQTKWLIPEPAPIVSAFTPEEIADRVIECLDPDWLKAYKQRARAWIDNYHSPNNAIRDSLKAYRRVLENFNASDSDGSSENGSIDPT